ncbi:fibronectin type III domain-containing protein [Brumimicrobium oceani]|uniref:fibronectin type III domain-containing protein n=1 Tax=Brumimicrobium oceani TaxID=2100725 RepID=UPI001304B993|nr:fibronectin type III domain-containing protein [Brumimicrobium oceani]
MRDLAPMSLPAGQKPTGVLGNASTYTATTSNWTSDGFLNSGSSGSARINIYGTTIDEWLVSPEIDLGTGAYQIQFDIGLTDYSGSGTDLMSIDDTMAVVISTDAGVTWSKSNILKLYTEGDQPSNAGETVTLDLSAYSGIVKIGFYGRSSVSNTDYNVYIDNFVVENFSTCAKPGSLSLLPSGSGGTFNWVENGTSTSWITEYDVTGYTPGSGTSNVTATTSQVLSSLAPSTTYDFYVRSICAPGDTSNFSAPLTFTTPCAAFVAPFNESFDGLALSSPYTDLPSCWEPQVGPDFWDVTDDVTNTGHAYLPNIGDHTTGTGNYMWIDASSDITENAMVTPLIDMTGLTVPYIGFWFASNNVDNNVNHTITLDAWDGSTWVNVTSESGNFPAWKEVGGPLPNGVPLTTKFRIRAIAATGTTSSDYYQNDLGIDDFFVVESTISCFKANAGIAQNITSSSADLSWTHVSATSFEVTLGAPGVTPGATANSFIVNSTNYNATGLSPYSDYEWYVRAICAPGDTSEWSSAWSFKTLCSAFTAPYYNGFENDPLDTPPGCWNSYSTISNGWVEVEDFTGTAAPFLGNQALYIYSGSGFTVGSDTLIAITPQFSDLSAGDKRIRFQANADNVTTRLIVGTIAAPTPSSTFNPIQVVTFNADDTYQQVIVEFTTASGYNGTDQYIVLAHELDGGTFKYIRIDEFNYETIPNCVAPSNLAVSAITSSSADLAWTENGTATSWEVEYGPVGFTLGSGTSSVESSTNATLSSLTDNTNYDVYVRAICAVGDTSTWTFASNFTTLCVPYTAPYYNGFENDMLDMAPGCWDSYASYSSAWVEVEDFTGTSAPFAGSQALYLYNSASSVTDTLIALSPQFTDLPAGDKRVRFQANADNVTTRLIVGTIAAPTPTSTFNPIETITFIADDTYQQVIVDITTANGYNGTDEYIVLAHELDGGTYKYIRIDEFNYEAIPTCLAPTNLLANATSATTANLSWTQSGSPMEWEVEYGAPGFTLGSGTRSTETSNSAVLTALTDDTDYEVYVRAICTVGDTSAWSLVSTFFTPCFAITAPYMQDFDGLALTSPYTDLPTCWEPQTLSDLWEVTDDVVNTGHAYLPDLGDHTSGTGNYMWIDASGDITANEMVSPFIDMSGLTTPLVGFWFASDNTDNSTNHTIALDAWDGSAWVNITTETGNFTSWVEVSGTLPAGIPTTTKFRIYAIAATGTTSSNYYQNDLGVDDFFVMEAPVCTDPSALGVANITLNSADLSWTENGTATTWNIEYGSAGFTPGSGTQVTVTSNPYTLTGLNPCSDYDYYVEADCGSLVSTFVGPFTFSTLSSPITGTDTEVACETFTWIDGNTYTASNNTATHTIPGAGAFGCDSLITLDLTINNSTTGTDVQTACDSYTWIDGNTYTSSNNTATFTIAGGNAVGCDSIVTLDLTINTVDVTTSVAGVVLTANAVGATYQWIDCDNGNAPIAGETNQDFTALANGNYAVIVTEGNCTDTSDCILVDNVGLNDLDKILGISLYPNPTRGVVTVQFENFESNQYALEVVDATGRKLTEQNIMNNSVQVDLSAYEKGVYMIRITDGTSESIHRVIKN